MTETAKDTSVEAGEIGGRGPTVLAVVQDRYGDDPEDVLHLERVPRPTPGPGEVTVSVRGAGVDRGVWHLMAGRPLVIRGGFGLRRPKARIRGLDVAGVVEAVGPDVTGFAPGDEVYGIAKGSYAEVAVAEAAKLAPKPSRLTFAEAAALPVSGLTALQAVRDQARVQAGERVLVLGASGGVGTYVVQLAVAAGAEVTGVASGAKADLVRALGATSVLDYATDELPSDGRFDVIVDTGGNRRLRDLRAAMADEGRLVIVGGETDGRLLGGFDRQLRAMALSPFLRQQLRVFVSSENGGDLVALAERVEAGDLSPAVEQTFPLEQTAAAVRHLIDGRVRGKVVIVP